MKRQGHGPIARCCAALVALLCLSVTASAQTVRGKVFDEAQFPVARAMVLLLDSAQSVTDRVVTSESGDFQVRGSEGGMYRLRVVRIGYVPTLSDSFTLAAGDTVNQTLVVSSARVQLNSVNVQGRRSCGRALVIGGQAERAAWEQAMASMANVSTSSSSGFTATTLVVQRELDGSGRRVRSQQVRTRTARVAEPWRSLPVDRLRKNGYAFLDETDTLTFVAPSVDVLLSDSFLEDHCIEPVTGSDSSEIGILFTPAPSRRNMAEVRGVLWLSRESAELRRLEFVYVNVPGMQDVRMGSGSQPGGLLEFSRLAEGTVVITNWEIRVPVLAERRGLFASGLEVRALNVMGGRTLLLRRNRDTLYSAPLVSVAGVVRDSVSNRPVAGAQVRLDGTGAVSTTDSVGRFALPQVLPGKYQIEAWTDSLAAVGARASAALTVTDDREDVVVLLPDLSKATRSRCNAAAAELGADTRGGITGIVRRLTDSGATALANVRVVADWKEVRSGANSLGAQDKRLETRSLSDGTFSLCGVPLDVEISVRAVPDNGQAEAESVRLEEAAPVALLFLTVDTPPMRHQPE